MPTNIKIFILQYYLNFLIKFTTSYYNINSFTVHTLSLLVYVIEIITHLESESIKFHGWKNAYSNSKYALFQLCWSQLNRDNISSSTFFRFQKFSILQQIYRWLTVGLLCRWLKDCLQVRISSIFLCINTLWYIFQFRNVNSSFLKSYFCKYLVHSYSFVLH